MERNNKVIGFVVLLLLVSIGFNFYFLTKDTSPELNPSSTNIATINTQQNTEAQEVYSVASAMASGVFFDTIIDNITESFNYKNLLLAEFEKVKNVADFEKFEGVFGKRKILFIAIVDKNKELLHKYNTLQCQSESCPYSATEVESMENDVIKGLSSQGYYDGGLWDGANFDQIFLAMSSKTISEKIDICSKNLWNDNVANQTCKDVSYYISSSRWTLYCDQISDNGLKKLCADTYIKQ